MFILSNNKFLLAVFAMAACMASSANAEGTGARVRRRELKSGKSSKSAKDASANTNSVTVDSNSLITAPVIVIEEKTSLQQMREKCPDEANLVNWCDSQNPYNVCEMCVLGQVKIHQKGSTIDHSGLHACNKLEYCTQCNFKDIENLYNCEMGLNTTSTNTNSATTPDMTTPTTGTIGGGVSADVSSGVGPKPDYHPGPLPSSVCPPNQPISGDPCDTGGYKYSECDYPDRFTCTCHSPPNNLFSCLKNDDN